MPEVDLAIPPAVKVAGEHTLTVLVVVMRDKMVRLVVRMESHPLKLALRKVS